MEIEKKVLASEMCYSRDWNSTNGDPSLCFFSNTICLAFIFQRPSNSINSDSSFSIGEKHNIFYFS